MHGWPLPVIFHYIRYPGFTVVKIYLVILWVPYRTFFWKVLQYGTVFLLVLHCFHYDLSTQLLYNVPEYISTIILVRRPLFILHTTQTIQFIITLEPPLCCNGYCPWVNSSWQELYFGSSVLSSSVQRCYCAELCSTWWWHSNQCGIAIYNGFSILNFTVPV